VKTDEVTRLKKLDTCLVSDAMDALGLSGHADGLRRLTVRRLVAGRVITVELGPPGPTTSARHLGTAAVEAAGDGDVIVVAAGGRTDAAGWGGVLGLAAAVRGVAGVIIDGACRDVDEIHDLDLPLFARGATPRTARGRLAEIAWNGPISVAGHRVEPGDLVIADDSGVIFVPAGRAGEIIATAERLAGHEQAMAERARAGEPVSQIMSARYESMLRPEGPTK
jgi:4-hydroxy-4-methyl-2-oxoglutarate aldolase